MPPNNSETSPIVNLPTGQEPTQLLPGDGGLAPDLGDATFGGPNMAATPELDALTLFGSGLVGMGGYALSRFRARRKS